MSERTLPTVEELRANGCGGYTFDELVGLKAEVLGFPGPIPYSSELAREGCALGMASWVLAGKVPPKSDGLSKRTA